jgi:hypothetical protein
MELRNNLWSRFKKLVELTKKILKNQLKQIE